MEKCNESKIQQITRPGIAIHQKLADLENIWVWTYEKRPQSIRLYPKLNTWLILKKNSANNPGVGESKKKKRIRLDIGLKVEKLDLDPSIFWLSLGYKALVFASTMNLESGPCFTDIWMSGEITE